ncbi:TSUP family transporter [Demequina sp. SYSU T00039]|uniref:Probable membrane transporter protein n=1 Tax=Demequina lignilytica TaxID=3051663 RepID=A0AAW7M9Z2_9MICO|nr:MULTISPECIES: TSUP family transporter [unclassified Demequina]MDN4478158.1 TSUP family transporter [Demequina sp. SYSU T00039-1]MDN4488392.1 TSUP family transporter [Demequina sp. SYSU T00039]MDN4490061.1 TSUP family transporter [Demequina sp. SYSU T00068]
MDITWQVLLVLGLVALLAGFLDTLAGGGGLLTLPALLLAGVPPLQALGTNKLQGSFGTGMATLQMLRHRRVRWDDARWPMLWAFLGSAAGSVAIQFADSDALRVVIPVVLGAIAAYFAFVPKAHRPPERERMSAAPYEATVVPAIGAYDGAFGPGTGSLFALAGVTLRAYELPRSTAVAKTLNFATNVASLLVFAVAGKMVWLVGGVMIVGQLVGAYVASHVLFKVSPVVLRVLIVVMSAGMLVRVLLG